LPGIMGGKMSSSDAASKVDLLDGPEDIEVKINKAYCPEGELADNGIMAFMKYVIMVLKQDKDETFLIERPEKFGGQVEYKTYDDLERDFMDKKLHPQDLKKALSRELVEILRPVREYFTDKRGLVEAAYPEE